MESTLQTPIRTTLPPIIPENATFYPLHPTVFLDHNPYLNIFRIRKHTPTEHHQIILTEETTHIIKTLPNHTKKTKLTNPRIPHTIWIDQSAQTAQITAQYSIASLLQNNTTITLSESELTKLKLTLLQLLPFPPSAKHMEEVEYTNPPTSTRTTLSQIYFPKSYITYLISTQDLYVFSPQNYILTQLTHYKTPEESEEIVFPANILFAHKSSVTILQKEEKTMSLCTYTAQTRYNEENHNFIIESTRTVNNQSETKTLPIPSHIYAEQTLNSRTRKITMPLKA